MPIAPLSLQANYWEDFELRDEDLEYLYNHLLEIETPLTGRELTEVLIKERIRIEKDRIERQLGNGAVYFPKEHYKVGEKLRFPAFQWEEGRVSGTRVGVNPEYPPFEVIDVEFQKQGSHSFASGIENHVLNTPAALNEDDPALKLDDVMRHHAKSIQAKLADKFKAVPDLVQIAGAWFPRSLLVDVNIGHLNLAEAVLEVAEGGPLPTAALLEQIELPTDVNRKLTEFSMNLALQEDGRFDEVGPSGETLWFLQRLEPEGVQTPPFHLRYQAPASLSGAPDPAIRAALNALVKDELEPEIEANNRVSQITISLIYPHWRSGTIPLSSSIAHLLPTAYEAPRVNFTFVDEETGKSFPGWVVRPNRYVYGLRQWYEEKGLMPGSLLAIKPGKNPGEVIIQAMKKRPTKDWIRTVLVGVDGGIVFTMLKQQITNEFDDRMAIMVPDPEAIDRIWEQTGRNRGTLENSVIGIMKELIKLSPQGHVHAQELYAGVNLIRRCPPGVILQILDNHPQVSHLGDLYFRLNETTTEE
jgi:hypothetical protein